MGYDGVRMYPCLARDTTRTPTSWSNLETAFSGHVELPNLINFRHFSLGIFISSCADSWQLRASSIMFDQDTTNIHGASPYRPYSEFHHCWWLFFQLFGWIPVPFYLDPGMPGRTPSTKASMATYDVQKMDEAHREWAVKWWALEVKWVSNTNPIGNPRVAGTVCQINLQTSKNILYSSQSQSVPTIVA